MANVVSQTITPALISFDGVSDNITLVAHRMCEAYLGQDVPLSRLTVTYNNQTGIEPIKAIENYPINTVVSAGFEYLFDENYVYPQADFVSRLDATFIVTYLGGIEPQVYDAIRRQAFIFKTRPNVAPEIEEPGTSGFNPKLNPLFRTGLASDVKHQLFSSKSKIVGF